MITSNDALTVLAAGLLVVAAALIIAAVTNARHARRASYYVIRRHHQDQANRQFVWSLLLLFLSAVAFVSGRIIPQPAGGEARPTRAAPEIAFVTPSTTPVPAPVVTMASMPVSTPTPTPAPAAPVTATAPAAAPAEHRRLTLHAIGSDLDPSIPPISSTSEFTIGVQTVVVFFDYRDIAPGALVRNNWFHDGNSTHFDSFYWDRAGAGMAYIAWSPSGGFEPGIYEIRVFLENTLEFIANFLVK